MLIFQPTEIEFGKQSGRSNDALFPKQPIQTEREKTAPENSSIRFFDRKLRLIGRFPETTKIYSRLNRQSKCQLKSEAG